MLKGIVMIREFFVGNSKSKVQRNCGKGKKWNKRSWKLKYMVLKIDGIYMDTEKRPKRKETLEDYKD